MYILTERKEKIGIPHIGFDIETTTGKHGSYMYVAMFGIPGGVIFLRTWDDVRGYLSNLKNIYKRFNIDKIIIWVHNLSYEWQFMRKELNVTSIFAKSKRNILKCEIDNFIEFRDTLAISQCSLAQIPKIYNLPIKKMVGDLEYKTSRNSKTPLTPTELKYCENDVLILVEFSKFLVSEYCEKYGFLPLTSTSIPRHFVKEDSKNYKKYIKNLVIPNFPKNEVKYNLLMRYLFQGGVTHANPYHANEVITDLVAGYDIKSAYPYHMLSKEFPVGSPIKVKPGKPINFYLEKFKDFSMIFQLEIFNISLKKTSPFSFLSKSKMIEEEGFIEDNGKLWKADRISIFATEIDAKLILETYDFSILKLNYVEIYQKQKLPEYVTDNIIKNFNIKENNEKDTIEYTLAKWQLNSIYGMTVTRLVTSELIYENNEVITDPDYIFNYSNEKRKAFLSPLWGIWITAYERELLISTANRLGQSCIYCDTDSIYCFYSKENDNFISKYNQQVIAENSKTLPESCKYLGTFERESVISKFKTIGAKRYVYRKRLKGGESVVKTTVAGMRKGSLDQYCKENKCSLFECFNDGLVLDAVLSNKTTMKYIDEETEEEIIDNYGNTEIMRSKSSGIIQEIPFSLGMSKNYLKLLYYLLKNESEENSKYEDRIY